MLTGREGLLGGRGRIDKPLSGLFEESISKATLGEDASLTSLDAVPFTLRG